MSKKPDDRCPPMLAPLLSKLIDSRLSDEDLEKLQHLLLSDTNCRRYYMRFMQVHAAMQWSMGQARPQQDADIAEGFEDQPESDVDVDTFLSMLEGSERYSDPLPPIHIDSSTPLTNKAYSSALSYIVEHTFTPKRLAALAAAAVLLLGVVLSIVLLTGGEETPEVATLPDFSPRIAAPDPNRVVATVTDQVNAQWVSANGQGALPDRMLLAVNQRLTLVKGFAEITTLRGAKVLVQAPATIETTESDNAIRLHRGKLVGRCETPGSKGFTVHAPGMDVVDLGTVFGVTADEVNGSTVLVMEGSVRAEPADTSPLAFEPVVLEQNDARRVDPEIGELKSIAAASTPTFYEAVPGPYIQEVLDARPVALWRFEDQAENKVVNSITPGHNDLLAIGPVALEKEGVFGSAARIDNSTDQAAYYEMQGALTELGQSGAFTLEFWYFAQERHPSAAMLVGLSTVQDYRFVAQFELQPMIHADANGETRNLRLHHSYGERSSWSSAFSAWDYPVGRWQHLAVVKKGSEYQLYADGKFYTKLENVPRVPASLGLMIGHSVSYIHTDNISLKRPFTGLIDEVAVYDTALTPEQIARRHALGIEALNSQ